MNHSGPSITYLTHRLAQAPPAVLDRPRILSQELGIVSTAAMASDLLLELGGPMLPEAGVQAFLEHYTASRENTLVIVQVVCYLCHDDWLAKLARQEGGGAVIERLTGFLTKSLVELAKHAKAKYFVDDPEGREEISRLTLAALELVPEGETENQARDRLNALDSVERAKVIGKTKDAMQRAREIREALARKAAEEAASKMTRE